MKIASYEDCEIGSWGYMSNGNPTVLKNAIDARGLTLVGATVGRNFLDDVSVEEMCKTIDDRISTRIAEKFSVGEIYFLLSLM